MRIAIFSHWFLPHVGGQERLADMLAEEFSRMGHEVVVITGTPGTERPESAYEVVRKQGWLDLLKWTRWADCCVVFGPTVRYLLMPLLFGRRFLATHHAEFAWDSRPVISRLQWLMTWWAAKRFSVQGPSQAICARLPRPCVLIPNPYDADTFVLRPSSRPGDLLYVGRLSEEKGVDTLLLALAALYAEGLSPRLSIIGLGSMHRPLQDLAKKLGIHNAISWLGLKSSAEVAKEMNRHQILVVPSRCKEAFGIVVLEGLASGCRVVVARDGGLVEAGRSWVQTFANGDPRELADQLRLALALGPAAPDTALEHHLHAHSLPEVAKKYLQFLTSP